MNKLTIGKLGQLACINKETVRYYQRIGLIIEPQKPISGYRIYPEETVARLAFIKRAKLLGFSLDEIKQLLQLDSGECEQTRQLAEQKQKIIQAKITDLQNLANTLNNHIKACQTSDNKQPCPLISSLSSK